MDMYRVHLVVDMGLKKKIDFRRLTVRLTKNNLPLIGNKVMKDIIVRTQKGKDRDNRKFEKYTDEYLDSYWTPGKRGQKRTDKKRVKDVKTIPNLTKSQNMLNAMRWKKITDGIRLYFQGKENNSKAHGNQVKNGRKFLGVDDKQAKKIKKDLISLSKK